MIVRTYQRRQRGARSSVSDPGIGANSVWSSSQESFTSSLSALDELRNSGDDVLKGLEIPELSHSSGKLKKPGSRKDRRLPDRHPNAKRSKVEEGSKQRTSLGIQARVLLQSSQVESQKAAPVAEPARNSPAWGTCSAASLMETKESGELLEHVDEANFAMDGLRHGQPVFVQRASLASILSLCGSLQKRRILRIQGMCKPLLDAVVALPADDPPIALGAAAVLYLLAIDTHDEDLLDSAACIQFLMRLLGAGVSQRAERSRGLSSVGAKLLKLSSGSSLKKAGSSGSQASDAGAASVLAKVRELFGSNNHRKVGGSKQGDDRGWLHGEEVSSKWLALLTLEKACISTVVLEDVSGSVKKVGGSFKERLRELGGLDTVSCIAASCVSNLRASLNSVDRKEGDVGSDRQEACGGAGMLLRCFRVMENVTFLSEPNRKHLLELRLRKKDNREPGSFVELLLDASKVLSELVSRRKSPHRTSRDAENAACLDSFMKPVEEARTMQVHAAAKEGGATYAAKSLDFQLSQESQVSSSSRKLSYKRRAAVQAAMSEFGDHQRGQSKKDFCGPELPASDSQEVDQECLELVGMEAVRKFSAKESLAAGSCDELAIARQKEGRRLWRVDGKSKIRESVYARDTVEDQTESSSLSLDRFSLCSMDDIVRSSEMSLAGDSSSWQPIAVDAGGDPGQLDSALFDECLLSAVKVVMNLTNDNPVGCRQVASFNGLDTMASLIVQHYAVPYSLPQCEGLVRSQVGSEAADLASRPKLAEEDLDLLVTVLGVLVNLVEKDDGNRARLAKMDIVPPAVANDSSWENMDMISLLCLVFLSKYGAGEVREDHVPSEVHDEARLKREAEDMIVEAYAALLLAFLSTGSDNTRSAIAERLPKEGLKVLVPVLERFLAFHLSLNMISPETQASVENVINSCKQPLR